MASSSYQSEEEASDYQQGLSEEDQSKQWNDNDLENDIEDVK